MITCDMIIMWRNSHVKVIGSLSRVIIDENKARIKRLLSPSAYLHYELPTCTNMVAHGHFLQSADCLNLWLCNMYIHRDSDTTWIVPRCDTMCDTMCDNITSSQHNRCRSIHFTESGLGTAIQQTYIGLWGSQGYIPQLTWSFLRADTFAWGVFKHRRQATRAICYTRQAIWHPTTSISAWKC